MNKERLILGNGYIGSRLQTVFQCPVSEDKIATYADAQSVVDRYKPRVIFNCIGAVGERNIDDCESDIDQSLASNTFVPIILAEVAYRNNIKLVHISSGCIYHFDYAQQSPITEEADPDYFDLFYSRTKIYAEKALLVMSKVCNILCARIRVPLDNQPHRRNILDKLIRYKKVIDTPNSVTYIPDFIKALEFLIQKDARGLYNIVNAGALYYPELMEVYKKYVPDFNYTVIKMQDLNLKRTNLLLSPQKLAKEGFAMRPIHDVLDECVQSRARPGSSKISA